MDLTREELAEMLDQHSRKLTRPAPKKDWARMIGVGIAVLSVLVTVAFWALMPRGEAAVIHARDDGRDKAQDLAIMQTGTAVAATQATHKEDIDEVDGKLGQFDEKLNVLIYNQRALDKGWELKRAPK